jgi:hypothetical protein
MGEIMVLEGQLTDNGATTKFIVAFGMRVMRRIRSIAEHCKTQETKSNRPNGDA